MKITAILPPFLPIESIRKQVDSVMPGVNVITSTDFDKDDAEVLIATTFTKIDDSFLAKFPELKFIQIASTGYDNVDAQAVKTRKITMCNAPGSNKESVAEHVIAMSLSFLKDLNFLDSEMRKGNWPMLTASRDLKGKVFGIVGLGGIGRKLVERLIPFEVAILYSDVHRLSEDDEESLGVTYMELDDLLKEADIVSLHVPLDDSTKSLLNAERLALMKDGAILINTCRGGVVDETALIDAIKSKGIRAGVDVYLKEPPDFSSELFKLDNTIFTPHIAGVTGESQSRFLEETVANVMRYVQGVEPLNVVVS